MFHQITAQQARALVNGIDKPTRLDKIYESIITEAGRRQTKLLLNLDERMKVSERDALIDNGFDVDVVSADRGSNIFSYRVSWV